MGDRELLEAAARAAGMDCTEWSKSENAFWQPDEFDECCGEWWNPLTDDGDALRLAVRLNITVGFDVMPDGAIVYASAEWHDRWDRGFRLMEWLLKDANAATRRAIVRAAASLAAAEGKG